MGLFPPVEARNISQVGKETRMPELFPRGRFVWHELMTTDPQAAIDFYTKVIGWKVTGFEQDPSYRMWTMGGTPMGGLMLLPEEARKMGAPPHWLMYVLVPDVDSTVRQAVGLGGRTHLEPQDIPTIGRFAVLADPQGAFFAVFTPSGGEKGSEEVTIGDFSWHELATTDFKEAWNFYNALFGWDHVESFDMGPAGMYWMFAQAGSRKAMGGMYNSAPERGTAPHWLCYVMVRSADQAAQSVTRLGGKVLNGPMDVPGGDRVAQCMDPQGAVFAVHSVAARIVEPEPRLKPAKPKARVGAAKPKATKKAPKPKVERGKAKAGKAKAMTKAKAKPKAKAKAKPKARKAMPKAKPRKARPKTRKAGSAKAKAAPRRTKAKRAAGAERPRAKSKKASARKGGAQKRGSRSVKRTARTGAKRPRK
jgi:hypothetical protein